MSWENAFTAIFTTLVFRQSTCYQYNGRAVARHPRVTLKVCAHAEVEPLRVFPFHSMSWTQSDTAALQEMIAKAKECGMWEQMAMTMHGGSPSSEFTLISGSSEGMTDASKRRATEELADLQQPFLPGNMGTSLVNRKGKTENFFEVQHEMARGIDVKVLPEGVPDFATWGRTRIQFGKYEGKNMSYLHLANSQSPECLQYKLWCTRRVKTATGLLKDLAEYLVEHERVSSKGYASAGSSSPFIPGTDRPRLLMDG